jgi:hypothetical protein
MTSSLLENLPSRLSHQRVSNPRVPELPKSGNALFQIFKNSDASLFQQLLSTIALVFNLFLEEK